MLYLAELTAGGCFTGSCNCSCPPVVGLVHVKTTHDVE